MHYHDCCQHIYIYISLDNLVKLVQDFCQNSNLGFSKNKNNNNTQETYVVRIRIKINVQNIVNYKIKKMSLKKNNNAAVFVKTFYH